MHADDYYRLIKQLREMNVCDPECRGRCQLCPDEVALEAASAIEDMSQDILLAREREKYSGESKKMG